MEREASVKLTLNGSQFIVSMKHAGDAVEESEKKAKRAASAWSTGMKGASSAVGELGGKVKDLIMTAGGLGAAFSLGDAAHKAISARDVYKDLAFQISNGTGKAVEWQAVQRDVEESADRWKRSNEEVAASYKQIFEETGDADFSKKAADSAAMAANASGKSMSTLSSIAGTLNEKFGITGDQVGGALASVLELGSKGGVTVEDLGEKLGIVGASAKQMGMEGQAGLQQVLGMLNAGDNVTGSFKKNIAAVTGLMETFGNTDKLKKIEKDLGIKLTDKGGAARKDALDKILSKSGGKEEILAKFFSGDTLKLVSDYGRTFQKVFNDTEGNTKKKTDAALAAFHKALSDAGKTTLSAADLEKKAKERLNDPARNMTDALNKMEKAMSKPEMFEAMDSLAKSLPVLAQYLADFIEMAVKHPVLTGLGVVGATGLGGFAKEAAKTATVNLAKSTGKLLLGWGKDAGQSMAAAAAANPAWATAGAAFAAAAAVGLAVDQAVQFGKENGGWEGFKGFVGAGSDPTKFGFEGIDAAMNEQAKKKRDAEDAANPAAKKTEKELRLEKMYDKLGGGPSVAPNAPAGLAAAFAYAPPDVLGAKRSADAAAASEHKRQQAAPSGLHRTQRVKMEDADENARLIARYMGATTLKVEVTADRQGSRGPVVPPPPGT